MSNDTNHLKVSTFLSKPYVYADSPDSYSGFLKELLDKIGRKAGFTYEFVEADGYGSQTSQGWTGVMKDVLDGTADIGGQLTVTPEREDAVDFSKPVMSNGVNILVKKPSWFDLGLGYLVRPLSSDFWIMLLVVILLIGLVFFLIGKFSPYEWGNVPAERDTRRSTNSFSLRNSYLFALTTLTWQGFRETPKSFSGRIMAAFWMIFVLFTLVAYTANLTAYFLARPEQVPDLKFTTYEELLSSDYDILALKFGSSQAALRNSRSKTLRSIWHQMNSHGSFVDTLSEGIERVKSEGSDYAFFMDSKSAEYEASHDPGCELMVYGETLFPSTEAFVIPKSYWRTKFNEALDELRESGILDELKVKYWQYGSQCRNFDGRQYSSNGGFLSSMPVYPVSLRDMAVAILLLFLGFIAAMVVLIIEIVHYAVTKQGKKIEKPKLLSKIERPKIFKPKSKSAKPAPSSVEEGGDPEAGPSSDTLENVPLDEEGHEAGPSDQLMESEKAEV